MNIHEKPSSDGSRGKLRKNFWENKLSKEGLRGETKVWARMNWEEKLSKDELKDGLGGETKIEYVFFI